MARQQGRAVPLPYLEATNSRINIKQGFEKLPYSLVNADLSFWEENPGDWRVRLKAQPARTDVSLDQGDTGIVQLEAQNASRRGIAPDADACGTGMARGTDWVSSAGYSSGRMRAGAADLTAEMKLDGTPDSANVTTRLRATGVHRAGVCAGGAVGLRRELHICISLFGAHR